MCAIAPQQLLRTLPLDPSLPVAEQGLGCGVALLERECERLGRAHLCLLGKVDRLGPLAVLALCDALVAQTDRLGDLIGREQPGTFLRGLLDDLERILQRAI